MIRHMMPRVTHSSTSPEAEIILYVYNLTQHVFAIHADIYSHVPYSSLNVMATIH